MSLADNILVPHTADELNLLMKERLDWIEHEFPGLIQQVRDWMRSWEFRSLWSFMPDKLIRCGGGTVKSTRAPYGMRSKVAGFAVVDYIYMYCHDNEKLDNLVWLSDFLWRESVFYNKYIVERRLPTTHML